VRAVLAVFGPKGCGKSALLGALGQLSPVEPTLSIVAEGGRPGLVVLLEAPRDPRFLSAAVSTADGALLVLDASSPKSALSEVRAFGLRPVALALTKSDLLDPREVKEALERVREELAKAGWEVPVVPVSALDGRGLDELRALLLKFSEEVGRASEPPFRAVVLRREGGAVKAFVLSGEVGQGDEVLVHPDSAPGKVEGIRAFFERAGRGEWALLRLSGRALSKAKEGAFLSSPELPRPSYRPDLKLRGLSEEPLQNWAEVSCFLGPFGAPGRVMLLGREALPPGEECYAQMRLTEPLVAFRGDRVVLFEAGKGGRLMAVGAVLDPFPRRHKGRGEGALKIVERMEGAQAEEALAMALEGGRHLWIKDEIVPYYLPLERKAREEALRRLEEGQKVVIVNDDEGRWLAERGRFEAVASEIRALLEEFHKNDPISIGLRWRDLRRVLSYKLDADSLRRVLLRMEEEGEVEREGELVRLSGFRPEFSGRFGAIREAVERIFLSERPTRPPRPDEVPLLLPDFERRDVERVLEAMVREGILIRLAPQVVIHRDVARVWEEELKRVLRRKGRVSVGEFRDMVGTSRKFAIAFLEACDGLGLTKREGDYHVPKSLRRSIVGE